MSNTEMRTILQDLREVIAKEVTNKYMPLCVCGRCDNIIEGDLVAQIIKTIRGEND